MRQGTIMARVLVVDDTRANRDLFAFILERLGHEPLTAEDGAAAIRVARERKPDLAVIDILMPGLNGYDTARLMRADPELAGIPLIAVSVSPAVTRSTTRLAGFDGFLRLPVSPEAFIATIDGWIERPSADSELSSIGGG